VSDETGCATATDDLIWSARNTDPDHIEAALRELLRERHASCEDLAPARVLNLVVVVDRAWKGEIANRLAQVGRYHASRTVLCAVEQGRRELDALAVMSFDQRTAGGIGVMYERIEIEMGPSHLAHLDTVIDPVVVSEMPTVLWCPHGHREALDALLGMIDVMLLDSDDLLEPAEALVRIEDLLQSAYVVDLAWLRSTPWRERLAASFDPPDRAERLDTLEKFTVRHKPSSAVSALLIAGWLVSRLGWEATPLASEDGAGLRGSAARAGREIAIALEPSEQDVPGLVGVTVSSANGYSLSLDRGRGGLAARECSDGRERAWQILGASRGEGGILGEGVRQALLRDRTYGAALHAARNFLP